MVENFFDLATEFFPKIMFVFDYVNSITIYFFV